MKLCEIDGCTAKYAAKGMCSKHYQRQRLYGDPNAARQEQRLFSEEDRALALIARNQQRSEDQELIASLTGLRLGYKCLCRREKPPVGTWTRYSGKRGTVVAFMIDRYDNMADPYMEIGVSFTKGEHPDAWFLPNELGSLP